MASTFIIPFLMQATGEPLLAQDLTRMSLEELSEVEVTSVARATQRLREAPASIYVITREELASSGVRSVPEALRLAPNLHVVQFSSSSYGISARGFNDKREVQAFSNKLLILIDGRTVYSPLFSGVFYDQLDLVMNDIERIEVISGPGAALWGANAMNGVINIITRNARETTDGFVRIGGGDQEQMASARYGARFGGDDAYRVYVKAFERGSTDLPDGASARDRWDKAQGGFRVDWGAGRDAYTLQGDVYRGEQSLLTGSQIALTGGNVLARWERASERSQLRVHAFYDIVDREAPSEGAPFQRDTWDLEFQHSFAFSTQRIVWGGGLRYSDYEVENVGPLQFLPASRTLRHGNIFVQDTIALGRSFELTAGVKLEDNPYVDWDVLPDLRLAWLPRNDVLLWAAASRAVRAPTPFDVDVAEFVGGNLFLAGNPDFHNEEVTAYQVGYRGQPGPRVSVTISGFFNQYDDLRTVEPDPATVLPLRWDNFIEGDTYGLEGWANIQVMPRWQLAPGFRLLETDFKFKPGASGLLNPEQPGNDPEMQFSLKSSTDFGRGLSFDAFLRYVDELPEPRTPDYYELSARLAWSVSETLELSLSGFNLLDDSHYEYVAPTGRAIPRSVFGEVRWTF